MLKNLKSLRTEQNISQQQLANVIGVSQQSVNKYENHSVEPDIDITIKIADYFSVSVDYLIGRTEIRQLTSVYTEENFTFEEINLIKKYREANSREKEIIQFILKNNAPQLKRISSTALMLTSFQQFISFHV